MQAGESRPKLSGPSVTFLHINHSFATSLTGTCELKPFTHQISTDEITKTGENLIHLLTAGWKNAVTDANRNPPPQCVQIPCSEVSTRWNECFSVAPVTMLLLRSEGEREDF